MSRPPRSTVSFVFPATVAAVVFLIYGNTFSVPFVFDDIAAITQNPSLHHLSSALSPPPALSVTGRPLVNLSLALNYRLSGIAPWSYHAINLAIHLAAALTLFGVARRTLSLPKVAPPLREAAAPLAGGIALLWAVHPLQTATVTYVMQRTESLMALAYLVTFYAFIRHATRVAEESSAPAPRWSRNGWGIVAIAACFIGMASKEVMVSAPVIVLLYDRTFVSGSFRDAWRARRVFYLSLGASWILLAALLLGTDGRSGSAGFGTVSIKSYALTQLYAIAHYLRLAIWPHPLVFDYGTTLVTSSRQIFFPALFVGAVLVGTAISLRRWPRVGFLGVFFFAVLAPSSSFIPVATQTIAEHRMYLPLVAPAALTVLGLYLWVGRGSLAVALAAAFALGFVTVRRNADYRSAHSLWEDTVAKQPHARAHYNLGVVLAVEHDYPAALAQFEAAVLADPRHVEALSKLGEILLETGAPAEAVARFEAALALAPSHLPSHAGLARALAAMGRVADAVPHFTQVAQADPSSPAAHVNLGNALLASHQTADALAEFETARKLDATSSAAWFSQGNALVQLGRMAEAVTSYETAARLAPNDAAIHYNLGNALATVGRYEAAFTQFEMAAKLAPDDVSARRNFERLRAYLKK